MNDKNTLAMINKIMSQPKPTYDQLSPELKALANTPRISEAVLRVCSKCGGTAKKVAANIGDGIPRHKVYCIDCSNRTAIFKSADEAIAAWNGQASDDAIPAFTTSATIHKMADDDAQTRAIMGMVYKMRDAGIIDITEEHVGDNILFTLRVDPERMRQLTRPEKEDAE